MLTVFRLRGQCQTAVPRRFKPNIDPRPYILPMSGGWEYHRLFAPDQESVRGFIENINLFGEAELISLRSRENLDVVDQVGSMSVHMFAGLTDRQMEVLTTAYEEGILDVPSKGSMDDAAQRVGISRSTFGEHLRKATYQLISNAYPFIRPGGEP